ncbi:MAG TPA: nickel pincer cofactor biosynthesis protein LarB [Acidimicrobiales bacterium]|nr:nickel pincer cofactor biosynthesis protein LarB [Acidimicrobiales bacterium]
MDSPALRNLLDQVAEGAVTPDEAASRLADLPYSDLGFARVDHHRSLRQGMPEAIYGPGKTPEQVAAIVISLAGGPSGGPVLLTRANRRQVAAALEALPGGRVRPPEAELCTVLWNPAPKRAGGVVVITAGTADLPMAEECLATLEAYGFEPTLLVDCGVAGIHRLFGAVDELRGADAVVVVAGMEGALASIVGGITGAPVVAVPTSTGYGAALEGVTALLSMMSSCAAGVTVVGIDNGFGAATAVARLLR